MTEATLMHREDGTPCASTIRNDAGTLRCTEHGRAVWGSGRWATAPEQCACHEGSCLCVVQCSAPGCRGVRHDLDGNALEADGTPVTGPNGTPPAWPTREARDGTGEYVDALDAIMLALDAIMLALEDWAYAEGHVLSRVQRKHDQTVTVNEAVSVVFGYPCEECREFLAVKWGGGSRADFGGLLPPPAAVVAFVAALLTEP